VGWGRFSLFVAPPTRLTPRAPSTAVIAINAADPRAAEVNDVEDVERVFPGELERVLHAPLCRAELLVEIEGVADAA
jgi:inorganic pyrophosphatase